jgi:septal ring factor EnvC (AmiA/AmiB activator)
MSILDLKDDSLKRLDIKKIELGRQPGIGTRVPVEARMSAISALTSKIAAKNEEFSKKSQESWRLLEKIARLQQQHALIRDEMSSLRAEADDLNRKVARLEEIAADVGPADLAAREIPDNIPRMR